MQDPPPEKDANGQDVSLQSILNAIQSHSEQTSAAIKQINEGMERLSEKVDYMHQEQIEMESSQDVIRKTWKNKSRKVIACRNREEEEIAQERTQSKM